MKAMTQDVYGSADVLVLNEHNRIVRRRRIR
jgi:hypothetical protein